MTDTKGVTAGKKAKDACSNRSGNWACPVSCRRTSGSEMTRHVTMSTRYICQRSSSGTISDGRTKRVALTTRKNPVAESAFR